MCYQVDVISLEDNKAIITIGESKFLDNYHDTEVSVEKPTITMSVTLQVCRCYDQFRRLARHCS